MNENHKHMCDKRAERDADGNVTCIECGYTALTMRIDPSTRMRFGLHVPEKCGCGLDPSEHPLSTCRWVDISGSDEAEVWAVEDMTDTPGVLDMR